MILRCLVGAVGGSVFWFAVGVLLGGIVGPLVPGSVSQPLFLLLVLLYAGAWLLFGAAFGAYVVYRNFPPEP